MFPGRKDNKILWRPRLFSHTFQGTYGRIRGLGIGGVRRESKTAFPIGFWNAICIHFSGQDHLFCFSVDNEKSVGHIDLELDSQKCVHIRSYWRMRIQNTFLTLGNIRSQNYWCSRNGLTLWQKKERERERNCVSRVCLVCVCVCYLSTLCVCIPKAPEEVILRYNKW